MVVLPKKQARVSPDFSVLSSRPINWFTEILRNWRGWSYADQAVRMEYDFDAEKLKRHYRNDSDDSFTIARTCEVYGLETVASKDFYNGQINRDLKNYFERTNWTYKECAVRMWGPEARQDLPAYEESLQKFFQTRSVDAWKVARLCELFNIKHTPSWMFLKPVIEDGVSKRPRQLLLPFPI